MKMQGLVLSLVAAFALAGGIRDRLTMKTMG
jgi:hypothetical protein